MRAARVLIVTCLCALGVAAHASAGRLDTGVMDMFSDENAPQELARVKQAGARYVRLMVSWRDIAPTVRPRGFDAANPNDPSYRWAALDRKVQLAAAARLSPILSIQTAPEWAESSSVDGPNGSRRPSIERYAEFARAIAKRYDGSTKGLPRIRYWQVWNEPNLNLYLTPLVVGRKVSGAEWYRSAVNAFAGAVKGVKRDNVVIAGGLAPFTINNGYAKSIAPLRFMRRVLCLTGGANPRRTCSERVRFDVWSHHPYTTGGPTHKAAMRDDISLGDLPKMRNVLRAAERLGAIESRGRVRFWVTEFSWDSNPPDPKGVPAGLHARWVAEAFYRMWQSDVSLVTWFTLRDGPFGESPYQSGLWYRGDTVAHDRPKPALTAFRFPFVAFPRGARVEVWGRTPSSARRTVTIEQRAGGGWRTVAMQKAGVGGIFHTVVAANPKGKPLRARIGTVRSLAFSLKDPGDRVYSPFGSN